MNLAAVCSSTLLGMAATGLVWNAASADEAAGLARWRLAQQANPCAIYGSGYVAVHGAGECAQIRGRVRIEQRIEHYEARPTVPFDPEPGYAPAGLAPAEDAGRAHLRLSAPGGRAYAPDAPRTR